MIELMDAARQKKIYLNITWIVKLSPGPEPGLTNILLSTSDFHTVVGNLDDIAALVNAEMK